MESPGAAGRPAVFVRRLPLPPPLLALLADHRWKHPGDDALKSIMPWFEDPLDFLESTQAMARESQSLDLFADDPPSRDLFRVHRSSTLPHPSDLPWLDAEAAVLIAVNRNPGDDVAIALDYRTDRHDPRVIASDFWTDPRQCSWRTVTTTFTGFLVTLNLQST
ncbi:hypothetical protein ACTWPT_59520 [Nonomuraea sp. 3N208]|uniref:hypothetical protein n=1 Tax=Nonomuraea sp. 3N208 TaxID=3457421 RepID=UPI003FD24DEC